MKRTVPLLIAAVCGVVLIITAFIPATVTWGETAAVWFDVLAAIAFVLGGGNLLKVHLQKVSDRSAGWAYSLITVVTFLLTLTVGLLKWGVPPATDQEFYGQTFASMPIDQLPSALTYELDVDLPAKLARDELPASVRSQLELIVSGDGADGRLTRMKFRGWMTPGQAADLLQLHDVLAWKCAIEQLAEKASVPDELAGKVSYFADHGSLAVSGVLQPGQADLLRQLASGAVWNAAVEQLETISERTTTITVQDVPPDFRYAQQAFGEQITLSGDLLTVTGPLTPAMQAALSDVFEHARPLTDEQISQFVESLASLPGGLTDEQKNLLRGLLGSSWTASQLVAVLNDAGERPDREKTYCELLAEKQAGVTDLKRTIPATEPDVELNAAQTEALTAAVLDPQQDLRTLGPLLESQGEWIAAQQAALTQFVSRTPTIGQRNRLIAKALTAGQQQLSKQQFEFLLADYRAEHVWNEQLHELLVASHQVKYPWSGGYLQNGSPFWWSYEYAFKPLTATMFALLAFYVASAAFRAFRAKNLEAFLLLATAFIVLLGRTPLGVWLTSGLPDELAGLRIENVTVFIMSVINTAGNRAIMIGIALGIVSTSLKILLGVDRSYLGAADE